jgi:multiple sugar transport system ATP-binding protein
MIYVTHDQVEAMTLADQIVVMNAGRIEQVGAPMELYNRPQTLFVAGFIGSPRMNLITGEAAAKLGATTIGVRPEHIELGAHGLWKGRLRVAEHLGNETIAYIDSELGELIVRINGDQKMKTGEVLQFQFLQEHLHRFDESGRRIP